MTAAVSSDLREQKIGAGAREIREFLSALSLRRLKSWLFITRLWIIVNDEIA